MRSEMRIDSWSAEALPSRSGAVPTETGREGGRGLFDLPLGDGTATGRPDVEPSLVVGEALVQVVHVSCGVGEGRADE